MGALNIKDAEVAAKARKLAKLTGKSITDAVSDALDKSLKTAEHHAKLDRDERIRRTDEIVKRFQASLPPDAPSVQEIMDDMYDENGLPK
jgi:antitoxin VapB